MMFLSCSFVAFHPKPKDQKPLSNLFSSGYQLFSQKQYQQALPLFYEFLNTHTQDDDNYSWALFFLGISLRENGFKHASFDVFTRLIEQSPNAKIVTHVLLFLETAINQGDIGEDYIRETVFCSKNFGYVEAPLSAFIDYHQGMCNWQKGYIDWGNTQFEKIPQNSIYYLKYQYELARLMIQTNDIQKSIEILENILNSEILTPSLFEKTCITLARLFYEQKKYLRADQLYQKIHKYHPEQSRFLLERAWTHYHSGKPDSALGLLIGLNSPDLNHQITPEYFLLKALLYKDVCNYQKALTIVDEFYAKYQTLINDIKNRHQWVNQRQALQLLSQKKTIYQELHVLTDLENEQISIKHIPNKSLSDHLQNTYLILMNKHKNKLRTIAQKEYERMSNQLLTFEENMRLMNYEIGLDMYQRVKQFTNRPKHKSTTFKIDNPVIYPFIDEYWNDELDDLRVSLTNRCQTLEEWDIFFK